LLKERLDIVSKRRRTDDEDDLTTFLGSHPPNPDDPDAESLDPSQRAQRRALRSSRRLARQAQRQRAEAEEGYSTDAEIPEPDEEAYRSALTQVESRRKEVLADVKAEEFRDPGKGRWTTWREKYTDSYVGAWGGLGVVSVWEFWARLECIGWDPIEVSQALDILSVTLT
jgi:GC-rich sequence DNA-binding factor